MVHVRHWQVVVVSRYHLKPGHTFLERLGIGSQHVGRGYGGGNVQGIRLADEIRRNGQLGLVIDDHVDLRSLTVFLHAGNLSLSGDVFAEADGLMRSDGQAGHVKATRHDRVVDRLVKQRLGARRIVRHHRHGDKQRRQDLRGDKRVADLHYDVLDVLFLGLRQATVDGIGRVIVAAGHTCPATLTAETGHGHDRAARFLEHLPEQQCRRRLAVHAGYRDDLQSSSRIAMTPGGHSRAHLPYHFVFHSTPILPPVCPYAILVRNDYSGNRVQLR